MSDAYGWATPGQRHRSRHLPSPIFLVILAVFIGSGWCLWASVGSNRLMAFLFVLAGWVVSLCLHEFSHALTAYRYGDRGVAERGYLTLNPLKYTHLAYSIVLPLLFVILGGIGFPGGAVWVDRSAFRSKYADSVVSAAGPLTNAIIAVVSMVLIAGSGVANFNHFAFWSALSFLTFLQITATVLNSLPVPGFDGYGVVEPWLPQQWKRAVAPVAPYAFLVLFALLWLPPVNHAFFSFVLWIMELFGVPTALVSVGDSLFRFWLS